MTIRNMRCTGRRRGGGGAGLLQVLARAPLGSALLLGLAAATQAQPAAPAGAGPAGVTTAATVPDVSAGQREGAAITAARLLPGERLQLDGRLDHPAWQRAPLHDRFNEHAPVNGGPARQRTTVQVLYDDQALYVGIRATDAHPEALRAPLVRHDGVNRTQDFVAVYIDAVGSRQSAQFFRVNAAGSTTDGMHTAADDNEDFAPDFDYDAAAHRDAQGYTAVLRIPFASLRFASTGAVDGSGAVAWRMLVMRRTPGEQYLMDTSAHVPREAASFIATLQPLQGVVLPAHAQFLSLRPSLTWRRDNQQPADGPRTRAQQVDLTLDLKWRPLPELVVDGTLNPDFSQVALDVPQLSRNTRYALQLAEKRPFFFESSDLLRSPTDAIYTRSFTAPRFGARATWRGAQGLAGSSFVIDDRGGASVLLPEAYGTGTAEQPASRALAARALLDRGALQWGALAVGRRYADDRGDNQVLGPDLSWQIDDAWRLRAQWLASHSTAQPVAMADGSTQLQKGAASSGQRAVLKLVYQTQKLELEGWWDDASAGFRHDSGFVNQVDMRHAYARIGRGWQGLGPFNDFWINLDADRVVQRGTGLLVSRDWWPNVWLTGAHNLEWWLQWHGQPLQRTAASAPLLQERYWRSGLTLSPARWAPLLKAKLQTGRLADVLANQVRPGATTSLSLQTRPLPWLELEPGWWLARLDGEAGRHVYRESAAQLLAVAHLDARQTLRAIVQRSRYQRLAEAGVDEARDAGLVGSLTYALRRSAGTVLYVGASRQRQGLGAVARGNEAFVKLQVDVDEVRALRY
jgi:hypothetical protein